MASRKRRALSLEEKLTILRKVDENPTGKKVCVAKELGLTLSTLNSIITKRGKIEENAWTFDVKCKQGWGALHMHLGEAVFKWLKHSRAADVNFDGTILREKAMKVADKLRIENFSALNRWVDRFKRRHGICYRSVGREAAGVDMATVHRLRECGVHS